MRDRSELRCVARWSPPPLLILLLLSLALLVALTACGGGQTPTPTAIPPTHPPPPAATPAPPSLARITWARAIDPKTGAPVNPVQQFATTDKTIYAVLQAPELPKGAKLGATWTFNGAPVPVPAQTVTISHEERSSWVEFHLTWSAAGTWPDGTLKITITIDGKPARTADIAIVRPGGAIRDDVP